MLPSDFEYFLDKLIYLGANLGIRKPLKQYVDLEEFIVDASLFVNQDSRTREAFFNWLYLFAPYFSPSKVRRILKKKDSNPKSLGEFVQLLKTHPLNSQNWNILNPWIKHKHSLKFNLDQDKYLKRSSYIIKTCPELRFRIEGNNQVLADLKAYLFKNKEFASLYMIAKETFNPKNRINYEYRLSKYI